MSGPSRLPALFALAIFASALLLFVAEPMAAKLVLPLLGGAPSVWNGCMLFFQAALLAGYLYAHLLGRLSARAQVTTHAVVLAIGFVSLPVALGSRAAGPGDVPPLPWLLATLATFVGIPFFALAATGPLVQRWFSRTDLPGASDPYFLYAGSNAGSLLGLLLYPFVLEPALRILTPEASLLPPHLTPWSQSTLWTVGFLGAAGLTVASGLTMVARREFDAKVSKATAARGTWRERLLWIALAAIPSSLVLGATQYITTDVAVVPLLWVVPLAAYLLSFVLAFSPRTFGSERFWGISFAVLALGATLGFWALSRPYAWALLILHPLVVLSAGMVCHRRLVAARPSPERLTEFYLCVAAGGLIGGAFNAVLAPLVFPAVIEYPLALLAASRVRPEPKPADPRRAMAFDVGLPAAIAATALLLQHFVGKAGWEDRGKIVLVLAVVPCLLALPLVVRPRRFTFVLGALMAIAWYQGSTQGTVKYRERTFFGVHTVIERPGIPFSIPDDTGKPRTFQVKFQLLNHNTTKHGTQSLDPAYRTLPTSYYHRSGPLGQVFAAYGSSLRQVAVIGAGAGTIAAYGEPGRRITFFEIDPAIVRIARDPKLFTFVHDSRGDVGFVVGDGRLRIAEASDSLFDLIVVDAFNSDAIPVHLLTREAVALYFRKLKPGGLLALHLSNQNLDLVPVVDALVADAGLAGLVEQNDIDNLDELLQGKDTSQWAVVARDRAVLAPLTSDSRWLRLPVHPGAPPDHRYLWTDDYSSLFSIVESW